MNDAKTNTAGPLDLSAHPIFKKLSPETVREIAATTSTVRVQAGDTIFLEREPGDAMYLIESGTIRIWVHDEDKRAVTLSELTRGGFFGEMAVLTGGSRSANATAQTDATLVCLRRDRFEAVLMQHPQAALEVIRSIADRLRQTNLLVSKRVTRNANVIHDEGLSRLDRVALAITNKVGSVGFFLIIATWTVLWTSYNILASTVPALHWHAFDPFPAFVAYLLMSNVIQILLMPLIMVGQNLQSRHSEVRAELDFETNQKAEREVTATLLHLERNTALLLKLMQHLDVRVSDEEMRAIAAERTLARQLSAIVLPGENGPRKATAAE
ncbi:MAG TPA: cyclic nucleotide-binding domain-containing protein [Vicinamibacterales bacterium]|nr:cyclic nucleotide-binding domain-containing protein [Vicinamibacterales bacterium]